MLSLIDLSAIEVLNHCIGSIFKPKNRAMSFARQCSAIEWKIYLYTLLINFIQHQTTYYRHTKCQCSMFIAPGAAYKGSDTI